MGLATNALRKLGLYYPVRNLYWKMKFFGKDTEAVFTEIYHLNHWNGIESRSGQGSSLKQTRIVIEALPGILNTFEVSSILDIPCGDFNWMSFVPLGQINYVGADLVPELIEHNQEKYGGKKRLFQCINLIEDPLPRVDLVFCRDCLVHLPYEAIFSSINNIKGSGAKYLMATTFIDTHSNRDISIGDFRPLNLEVWPFNFPSPICILKEGCTESDGAHTDKSMGVWCVDDLPNF